MSLSPTIPFIKLDPRATTPRQGKDGDAGHDLFPLEEVVLPAKTTNMAVATGIAVDIDALSEAASLPSCLSVYGRVAPRSGLAFHRGIDVLAGVIDEGYRDQIHVILTNPSDKDVVLKPDKAIAQIVFEVYLKGVTWKEVHSLSTSERGLGKFGSTDTTMV